MYISSPKTTSLLKAGLEKALAGQGFEFLDGRFILKNTNREGKRSAHQHARESRLTNHIKLLEEYLPIVKSKLISTESIDVDKIKPRLIEVPEKKSKISKLFLWWNLVWWSLPYEKAYGRQMRFIIWDDYHDAPMGLIGLQSPILKWNPRDSYLGIPHETRDYWVNQSMSAQRLGALPPYNKLLGGKLVASVVTSTEIRQSFYDKYHDRLTEMEGRNIPANLLFVTTTGAFGKSSVYHRLKDWNGRHFCEQIGETVGAGSFHIPASIYEGLIEFLKTEGKFTGRHYGSGPSKKMKNIDTALTALGYKSGISHGIKRSLYLFRLASNIEEVISKNADPIWTERSFEEIAGYWKERWAKKRQDTMPKEKLYFDTQNFCDEIEKQIEKCKGLRANNE